MCVMHAPRPPELELDDQEEQRRIAGAAMELVDDNCALFITV